MIKLSVIFLKQEVIKIRMFSQSIKIE